LFFRRIMTIWWLHALVFIFGYITCKTFYFLNTTRVSLKLLKSGRVAYLLMCVKAVEQYVTAGTLMKHHLEKTEENANTKKSFDLQFNNEMRDFKVRAIREAVKATPEIFRENLQFHDWASAMLYLENNRDEALKFWGTNK
jgi:hypothetical protein